MGEPLVRCVQVVQGPLLHLVRRLAVTNALLLERCRQPCGAAGPCLRLPRSEKRVASVTHLLVGLGYLNLHRLQPRVQGPWLPKSGRKVPRKKWCSLSHTLSMTHGI